MTFPGLRVADDADDCHAIELPESVGHAALEIELALAHLTPGLEIVWIATVLDEPSRGGLPLEHVPADDGGYAIAVTPAVDHHRLSWRHGGCGFGSKGVSMDCKRDACSTPP